VTEEAPAARVASCGFGGKLGSGSRDRAIPEGSEAMPAGRASGLPKGSWPTAVVGGADAGAGAGRWDPASVVARAGPTAGTTLSRSSPARTATGRSRPNVERRAIGGQPAGPGYILLRVGAGAASAEEELRERPVAKLRVFSRWQGRQSVRRLA
jgi:hypothetical protein